MNITPELAAKVLDADLRNIVKKVSDGGILSPSERQMLQNAAFPESQAKAKRALVLALKYSSGARLTAVELAEVREMHPGFAPEAAASETDTAPSVGPTLALTPEPSPAAGDGEVTAAQIGKWSQIYGTERRQLYRWIERGKERGDPCPLDDRAHMPAWIEKHLDKIRGALREKVNAAASAARATPPAVSSDPGLPAAVVSVAAGAVGPMVASLDLASVGGVEGESVEFFRTIFAAVKLQLADAYKGGNDGEIRKLHTRLKDVGESLRKHEKDAEQRAIRLGGYLDKAEVFNEITEGLNSLALLREHRTSRVRAELSDMPQELLDRIAAVLEQVGRREESVLRNLASLKTPADVFLALAA